MKQFLKLIIFLISVNCATYAQFTDSLYVKENTFYTDFLNQVWENPVFYTTASLQDYTYTQLNFEQKDLNFKRVQTAGENTAYNFSFNGIYNINKNLRLFGDAKFTKALEKELGYNFSTERTETQNVLSPNYFFAPKKGNWEHQNYLLNGGLSYEFNNHILLGAKVAYKAQNSFRTIDPRPQIKVSDYGGELFAGYNYQKHKVFLSGTLGQETETNSILYVDDTQNAPVYTETFTRFSSGYGRVVFNSSYSSYIYRTITKGFGAGYQYQNNRHALSGTYRYSKSMENFYRKDANNNVYIDEALITFKYRVIAHNLALNYFYDGKNNDFKASVDYSQKQGDNFSVAEKGQNYRMNIDAFSVKAGLNKTENQKTVYAFELTANYQQHKYIDLLGSTQKKLNTLDLIGTFNKDFTFNPKSKLNAALAFGYYTALDEKLILIPTTTNHDFIDEVVLPDHAFDVTSKLDSKIVLTHSIKLPKGKQIRIFADWKILTSLNKKYQEYYELPNEYNKYFNTGIAILY